MSRPQQYVIGNMSQLIQKLQKCMVKYPASVTYLCHNSFKNLQKKKKKKKKCILSKYSDIGVFPENIGTGQVLIPFPTDEQDNHQIFTCENSKTAQLCLLFTRNHFKGALCSLGEEIKM